MSDKPESPPSKQPKPKGCSLDALLPAKAAVNTSIGTLYVRHAYTTDWKNFESGDAEELGMAAVRQLSSRVEDKHDSSPISNEDLEALTEEDFLLLTTAISKQSGWGEIPARAGLKELGQVARDKGAERHKQMLADMRKSIDTSYGFLGKDTLEKFQKQMVGLASIQSALADKNLLQAALRASPLPLDVSKPSLAGTSVLEEAIRRAQSESASTGLAIPTAIGVSGGYLPPRPENTRLGRATLESAENSREVSQKMDALVEVIAGINQTLVRDILPAWVQKIEEDQKSTGSAFKQAAKGLWLTKWAVIVSVFVTIGATWWQVRVATDIDRGNTEQQKQSEVILREQLTAQQKLIEQQARDSAAIREAIARTRFEPRFTAKSKQ